MTTSALRFFMLVLLLSVPFYLLGATGLRMPKLPNLPASALMTFIRMVAAVILVRRKRGTPAAMLLFEGALVWRRNARAGWYLIALLFMPVIGLLEFAVLRWMGTAVPVPQIAPGFAFVLFLVFFVGAIGEEVGWQGYAYPVLRARLSALRAAAMLGTAWALWHVIPFVQLGKSPRWILWHSLNAVVMRVVIVWLFENTRQTILVAVIFHAMINVSWALFPIAGSFYDPVITFILLSLATGPIIVVWGTETLARFQKTSPVAARPILPKEMPDVRN